jgi:hypothetical protein
MLIYPSFQQVSPLSLYVQQMQPLVVSDSTSSLAFKPAIDSENEIPGLDQTPTEYDPDDLATFSVIPAVSLPTYDFPDWHEPQYADQIPIGFRRRDWSDIWHGPCHDIDKFLMRALNIWTGQYTPWIHEHDFMGIQWRLVIDHRLPLDDLPIFQEGMIISIQNVNHRNYQYVVDHCAHEDEVNAYLKLVCYKRNRRFCTSWSRYPPIILAVPLHYSQVRMHDNMYQATPSGSTDSEAEEEYIGWRGKLRSLRKKIQAPWRQFSC